MNEYELRKKSVNDLIEVELLPSITELSLKEVTYKKYPVENLSALGVATQPLVAAMQTLKGTAGTSGIYRVNTKGLQMFESQGGYIGSLQTTAGTVGGGQAVMTPLAVDPTLLFMSMALMTVEKKLDDIKDLQNEILDFIKAKEKANLRGEINVLIDILNNYKFNFNNDKYKSSNYTIVKNAKGTAEKNILLYRDLLQSMLANKSKIHTTQEVDKKVKKADEYFKEYQTAIYLYSFSSFLEVLLLENFDKQFISSVNSKIDEYSIKYRDLYTECYNEIEGYSKLSIQTKLNKGIAEISKGIGTAVAKTPIISRGQIDEFLIKSGEKIEAHNEKKNDESVKRLSVNAMRFSNPFNESLKQISTIYNDPIEVLMDSENIYLIEENKK